MRRAVVTFFWLGYVPGAPGTAASAAVVLLSAAWYACCPWPWPLLALAVVGAVAGIALGRWAMGHFKSDDPSAFVLDEAVGQALACAAATPLIPSPWGVYADLAVAFVLFRALDILKPPPVRQAEHLPGGVGIMADDVLAGLMSAGLLVLLKFLWFHYAA